MAKPIVFGPSFNTTERPSSLSPKLAMTYKGGEAVATAPNGVHFAVKAKFARLHIDEAGRYFAVESNDKVIWTRCKVTR